LREVVCREIEVKDAREGWLVASPIADVVDRGWGVQHLEFVTVVRRDEMGCWDGV